MEIRKELWGKTACALRQIVTATADGAVAAHYAEQYL